MSSGCGDGGREGAVNVDDLVYLCTEERCSLGVTWHRKARGCSRLKTQRLVDVP